MLEICRTCARNGLKVAYDDGSLNNGIGNSTTSAMQNTVTTAAKVIARNASRVPA